MYYYRERPWASTAVVLVIAVVLTVIFYGCTVKTTAVTPENMPVMQKDFAPVKKTADTAMEIATVAKTTADEAVSLAEEAEDTAKRAEEKVEDLKNTVLTAPVLSPLTPTPAPVATPAFQSNMDSLDDPATKVAAQMALMEKEDITLVINELVNKGFTSHNNGVAVSSGRKIYNLYGERAIPVVLKYVHDDRVIVADWARKWYNHYSPGAILGRIEGCERVGLHNDAEIVELKMGIDTQIAKLSEDLAKARSAQTDAMEAFFTARAEDKTLLAGQLEAVNKEVDLLKQEQMKTVELYTRLLAIPVCCPPRCYRTR